MKKLKYFDLLAKDINFTIDNHSKYRTYIGSMISLIIILIAIILSFFSIMSVFNKRNPIIFREEYFDKDKRQIINSDNQHSIYFAILPMEGNLDGYKNNFRQDLINIELKLSKTYFNRNGTRIHEFKDIPLKFCEKDDFSVDYHNYYDSHSLKDAICPKYRNFSIYGQYSSNEFSYLRFSVVNCNNSYVPKFNNSVICKNREDTAKEIANLKFSLIYFFKTPDSLNYEKYTVSQMDALGFAISMSSYTRQDIYFMINDMYTDDNLIFPNDEKNLVQIQSFARHDNTVIKQILPDEKNIFFYSFFLRTSSYYTNYKRSYIKLDKVIKDIGGIIGYFMFVIRIISSYLYRDILFYTNIFNHSFYIKEEMFDNHSINNNSNEINTLLNTNKNKHKFELRRSLYYLYYISCCQKKYKDSMNNYSFLIKHIKKLMNIRIYLDNLYEIDLLKKNFIDHDQYYILEYLKTNKRDKLDYNSISNAYNRLNMKISKSYIDAYLSQKFEKLSN